MSRPIRRGWPTSHACFPRGVSGSDTGTRAPAMGMLFEVARATSYVSGGNMEARVRMSTENSLESKPLGWASLLVEVSWFPPRQVGILCNDDAWHVEAKPRGQKHAFRSVVKVVWRKGRATTLIGWMFLAVRPSPARGSPIS